MWYHAESSCAIIDTLFWWHRYRKQMSGYHWGEERKEEQDKWTGLRAVDYAA